MNASRSSHSGNFCGRTRREFVWETGCGFGAAALSSMLASDGLLPKASAATASQA
ncbi:MAG: DUF1501 domain-containing protein, partial [Rhodopirellula bahusiensis]